MNVRAKESQLSFTIKERKQFRIRFYWLDRAQHVFYPTYYQIARRLEFSGIIAWFQEDDLKIGMISRVEHNLRQVLATEIPMERNKNRAWSWKVPYDDIKCIFIPE